MLMFQHDCVGYQLKKHLEPASCCNLDRKIPENSSMFLHPLYISFRDSIFSPCHIKISGNSYRGGGNESKLADNIGMSKNWEDTENKDKAHTYPKTTNGKQKKDY